MPKVSVIIPIYNVEKYLKECIESALSQTHKAIELILVDDGSTDNSPKICDEFARADSRIKVIHKTNGGLASARNAGLRNATGEWIMMLDGDDTIDPDTLGKCIAATEEYNSDFVRFGMKFKYPNKTINKQHQPQKDKSSYLCNVIARKAPLNICGGLYKKSLFDMINPAFVDGINFGEDYSVIARLLYYASNPVILTDCLYNYNQQNQNSYVHHIKWEYMEQLICAEKLNYEFFVGRDGGKYLPFLKMGRASIKAMMLQNLYGNYKENSKYEAATCNLYDNDCDDTGLCFFEKVLLNFSGNKILRLLLPPIVSSRNATVSVIKRLFF